LEGEIIFIFVTCRTQHSTGMMLSTQFELTLTPAWCLIMRRVGLFCMQQACPQQPAVCWDIGEHAPDAYSRLPWLEAVNEPRCAVIMLS
jgi:hypothetical protein